MNCTLGEWATGDVLVLKLAIWVADAWWRATNTSETTNQRQRGFTNTVVIVKVGRCQGTKLSPMIGYISRNSLSYGSRTNGV